MTDWRFTVDKCGNCGASLARKKPADVELVTTRVAAEPDAPDVYAAPCPQCQRYNPVVEKGTAVEVEPTEPADEPTKPIEPPEPAEPAEPPEA